jgi:hypothetical protein
MAGRRGHDQRSVLLGHDGRDSTTSVTTAYRSGRCRSFRGPEGVSRGKQQQTWSVPEPERLFSVVAASR